MTPAALIENANAFVILGLSSADGEMTAGL